MDISRPALKNRRIITTLLLFFVLLGTVPLLADLPPLISRMAFYGGVDKSNFRISPDGSRLAYLGPTAKGGPGLWL